MYITRQGYLVLQQELDGLWKRRTRVTRALADAAAEGDRSENAEYIYRKKELREIDRRVRYLQKRLPLLKVVATAPADPSRVFFGACVTLEDERGERVSYRIVGPDEFDTSRGWISMDSPVARALMNRSLDDEVVVRTPNGETSFCITAVSYEEVFSV